MSRLAMYRCIDLKFLWKSGLEEGLGGKIRKDGAGTGEDEDDKVEDIFLYHGSEGFFLVDFRLGKLIKIN